jgi:DNA-binding MarR family transcriptional regulator
MSESFARELDRSIVCLNRRRSRFMAERLRAQALNGPTYAFLLNIDRNPGSSQDSLANHFSIDKGTVARYVKRLEKLGYLSRTPDERDRRTYHLFLTEEGRKVLPVIRDNLDKWSRQMLAGFSPEDSQAAFRIIERMTENSRQLESDSSPGSK